MAIYFFCSCGNQLQEADTNAGRTIHCPFCGASRTVPKLMQYAASTQSTVTEPATSHAHNEPKVGELASRGNRFIAALIDQLVATLVVLPFLLLYAMSLALPAMGYVAPLISPMCLAGLLALSIYQIVLLSTTGQSIGKRVMHIRIAWYGHEGDPGFVGTVFLRVLVPLGAIYFLWFALFRGSWGDPYLIMILSWINYLPILGQERRCIHDYVAGTKVIRLPDSVA